MRPTDALELVVLAAVWGASFLFTRLSAPEFGPLALIFVRVLSAALFLLPLVLLRRQGRACLVHWRAIAVVGVLNSAIPFLLFAWALLSITAGFASIGNATAPLWAALVAWLWLGERLGGMRALGLLVGFVGVGVLASGKAGFHGEHGLWAVGAVLLATLCYGISANVVRRHLSGVSSLSIALGSQVVATVVLAPLALWAWPAVPPGALAWGSVLALGVGCTALAFISYFRLIQSIGPSRAIAVTYLIPAFGLGWGALFLDEPITPRVLVGAAVVLAGTALATGLVGRPARARAAAGEAPLTR
jgi:drug/metabolite transporter (DMT)-like permease